MGILLRRKVPKEVLILAAMSYMSALCLVPMIKNKESSFVDFHVKQGVVMWFLEILATLGLCFLSSFGQSFFGFFSMLLSFFSLIGIVSVAFSKKWRIIGIYNIATRL